MKKPLLLLFASIALVAGAALSYRRLRADPPREPVPVAVDARSLARQTADAPSSLPSTALPSSVAPRTSAAPSSAPRRDAPPSELNLSSTFYPQAPDADWSMPWQEACEEASTLLVANTVLDHGWSRAEFRAEILKLVAWENEQFGDYEHTSVAQTERILNDYLHLRTVVHEDPSFADVQRIITRGHFIVATFSGKDLGNPFYTDGGPVYHAMVIKGYKADGQRVIVSDVGTRRGEDYVYRWSTIQGALHDYAEPIQSGPRRFIEVLPPQA